MAPEDTGAWDSASLEKAGFWSLGVLSGLRMEFFLSLIKRDIFLANRDKWDKCQLQDKPLLSSGNGFS